MAIRTYNSGGNPLSATLCLVEQGGLALIEIWVKCTDDATFTVYGSYDGTEGTWRAVDTLKVPHAGMDNRHEGYFNAYRYIKVETTDGSDSEIEIVAGEM